MLFEKPKFTLHLRNVEDYFLDEFMTDGEVIECIARNALRLGLSNIIVIDHENDDRRISAEQFLRYFDIELLVKSQMLEAA